MYPRDKKDSDEIIKSFLQQLTGVQVIGLIKTDGNIAAVEFQSHNLSELHPREIAQITTVLERLLGSMDIKIDNVHPAESTIITAWVNNKLAPADFYLQLQNAYPQTHKKFLANRSDGFDKRGRRGGLGDGDGKGGRF
jgi:DNA recombination-dependent growth factor C